MIANYKNLTRKEYLSKLFDIFDCMQIDESKKTTQSEKDFLIEVLLLPKKFEYFRFSPRSKKYIIDKIIDEGGIKHSYQNLNNKIYKLIKKGYLWKDEDGQIYLKPFVLRALSELEKALEKGLSYDFTFRFK